VGLHGSNGGTHAARNGEIRGRMPPYTSTLAQRLTSILPAMTLVEAIETSRIHSVAGRTGDRPALIRANSRQLPSWPLRRCKPEVKPSCKNVTQLLWQLSSLVPVHGQLGGIFYNQRLQAALLPGDVSPTHHGIPMS